MRKLSETNPQFERNFADLAHAHLKERAPMLLDYLIGFQVVDKNDDETRAVGVFGFKVGKQWFYAPVFFLNGELKGHELLYLKEQDTFVPMEENWVNYLINRKPMVLGEGSPYNYREEGIRQPEFSIYSDSPLTFNKYSSAEQYGYWCRGEKFDVTPALNCFSYDETKDIFEKTAARNTLQEVCFRAGRTASEALARSLRVNPKFASAFLKFYDVKDVLLDKYASRPFVKKADDINYIDKGDGKPIIHDKPEKTDTGAGDLIILQDTDNSALNYGLTEGESLELLREGITIRDHRKDTTNVYDTQLPEYLTNPNDTGLYELLVKPHGYEKALIVDAPLTIGKGRATCCTVVILEDDRWTNMDSKGLYVRKQMHDPEWRDYYEGLTSISDCKLDTTYLIVGPNGKGTIPFTVLKKESSPDGYTELWADVHSYVPWRESLNITSSLNNKCDIEHHMETTPIEVYETGYKGDKYSTTRNCRRILVKEMPEGYMKNVGDTLIVPSSHKLVKLEGRHSDLRRVPGSMSDVQMEIIKAGAVDEMKVWSDGSRYQIQHNGETSKPLDKRAALVSLVKDHTIQADMAKHMLKTADEKGRETYLLKKAGPYSGHQTDTQLIPGPDAPPMNTMDDSGYFGSADMSMHPDARVQYPTTYAQEVPDLTSSYQYGGNADVYRPSLDDKAMYGAQQAANTGQKEVFDTSVLGGLVKAMDTDSLVDKYLGDLVIGEDRIGRILFMYYWHNDKFKERYGQEELQELEDALKNTFKSVGDLVLFLKKKTVEPELAVSGSDVNLDDVSQ